MFAVFFAVACQCTPVKVDDSYYLKPEPENSTNNSGKDSSDDGKPDTSMLKLEKMHSVIQRLKELDLILSLKL